jgi:hypothetical protein
MTSAAFNVVTINSTVLGGVDNPNFERREEQKPLGSDGNIHQTGSSVTAAAPMASFTTIAVRALLTLFGVSGQLPFLALDGSNGIILSALIPNASGPGYASGDGHPYIQCLNGDCYIKSFRWAMDGVCSADVEAFLISTAGSTNPIVLGEGAAPTLPVNTEQCVLGGITMGGTGVNNPTSLTVDIAHRGENNVKDICNNAGLPYPVLTTKAGIGGQTEIVATFDTTDLITASTGTLVATFYVLNALGVGVGATGFTLTLNGTITRVPSVKGSNGQAGKQTYQVRGTWNGTTRPFVAATF